MSSFELPSNYMRISPQRFLERLCPLPPHGFQRRRCSSAPSNLKHSLQGVVENFDAYASAGTFVSIKAVLPSPKLSPGPNHRHK